MYFKNYFRLAVYFSKFFSLFDQNIKKRISFYNYFKKRKKAFRKDILEILFNPKVFIKKRLAEVPNLVCNYKFAKKLFNWKPTTKLEKGLYQNIEWSKKNLKM